MDNTETRGENAMEVALARLRDMFLFGQLLPGEQIRQQQIAEEVGVSRVPLREALNVLAKQGALLHRPNQGYFVAKRLPIEQAQIRRMLELLEDELVSSLEWPDEATWRRLANLQECMRSLVEADDWTPMLKLNRQFHFEMFGLSPFKLILEQVDRLWTLAEPYTAAKLSTIDARHRTLSEHDELLNALLQRDRSKCVKILRQHRSGRAAENNYELPVASEHVSVKYIES
jgi:DNA-binding GntR family transcriptional regulator